VINNSLGTLLLGHVRILKRTLIDDTGFRTN